MILRLVSVFCLLFVLALPGQSQNLTIAQMKAGLEQTPNAPLYAKQVLKKRFKIDTVTVSNIGHYNSLADSLAYKGVIKKAYGPYTQKDGRFLVLILAKAPNTFLRISQIFIDTAVFRHRIADSLGNQILKKLADSTDTFGHLAQIYSMGGEASTSGDLGWIAYGMLVPVIEREVLKRKKGEVFKIWTSNGLHIIKKTEDPKKDTGFALMLRVFL